MSYIPVKTLIPPFYNRMTVGGPHELLGMYRGVGFMGGIIDFVKIEIPGF